MPRSTLNRTGPRIDGQRSAGERTPRLGVPKVGIVERTKHVDAAAAPVGRPGWTHYGAWDGSDLVATGAMFTTGRVAWIAFAATKASHRGRGAQSSLIAERVRRASDLGCDWVITETAEELPDRPAPSYRNLRRLGFTDAYRRQNYVADLAGR